MDAARIRRLPRARQPGPAQADGRGGRPGGVRRRRRGHQSDRRRPARHARPLERDLLGGRRRRDRGEGRRARRQGRRPAVRRSLGPDHRPQRSAGGDLHRQQVRAREQGPLGAGRLNDDRFATAFGDAAEEYERGRPGYPAAAIAALAARARARAGLCGRRPRGGNRQADAGPGRSLRACDRDRAAGRDAGRARTPSARRPRRWTARGGDSARRWLRRCRPRRPGLSLVRRPPGPRRDRAGAAAGRRSRLALEHDAVGDARDAVVRAARRPPRAPPGRPRHPAPQRFGPAGAGRSTPRGGSSRWPRRPSTTRGGWRSASSWPALRRAATSPCCAGERTRRPAPKCASCSSAMTPRWRAIRWSCRCAPPPSGPG